MSNGHHCKNSLLFILTMICASFLNYPIAAQEKSPIPEVSKSKAKEKEPPIDVPERILKLSEEGQYPKDAGEIDPKVEYRLFKPKFDKSKKYPLVIWLHGYGLAEIVNRNFGQLQNFKTTVASSLENIDRTPFFMLVPQRPEKITGWQSMIEPESESKKPGFVAVDAIYAIIDELKQDYPIDEKRISLVGISAGGGEGWTIVKQKPQLFSAFAPIAVQKTGLDGLDKLKDMSVWAFYSKGDRPGNAHEVIEQLNQVGGWGYYTEVNSFEHNCWGPAFMEYDLLPWLLDQEKGVHKRKPWTWQDAKHLTNYWPQTTLFAVIIILFIAVRREQARKSRGFVTTKSSPANHIHNASSDE